VICGWVDHFSMAAHARTVEIPEADRRELQRRARSKGAPAREVERARIVLLAGDGVPGKQIAARVGCAEPTVVTWRRRYADMGCPGWRTCRGRARPRRCRRRCGIGCWS
jgi:transposase